VGSGKFFSLVHVQRALADDGVAPIGFVVPVEELLLEPLGCVVLVEALLPGRVDVAPPVEELLLELCDEPASGERMLLGELLLGELLSRFEESSSSSPSSPHAASATINRTVRTHLISYPPNSFDSVKRHLVIPRTDAQRQASDCREAKVQSAARADLHARPDEPEGEANHPLLRVLLDGTGCARRYRARSHAPQRPPCVGASPGTDVCRRVDTSRAQNILQGLNGYGVLGTPASTRVPGRLIGLPLLSHSMVMPLALGTVPGHACTP
jgi:hypothetical protein